MVAVNTAEDEDKEVVDKDKDTDKFDYAEGDVVDPDIIPSLSCLKYCSVQFRSKSMRLFLAASAAAVAAKAKYSDQSSATERVREVPNEKFRTSLKAEEIEFQSPAIVAMHSFQELSSAGSRVSLEQAIQIDGSGTLLSLKSLTQLACSYWRWYMESIDNENNSNHNTTTSSSSTSSSTVVVSLAKTATGQQSSATTSAWSSADMLARSLVVSCSLECVAHIAMVLGRAFRPLLQQVK